MKKKVFVFLILVLILFSSCNFNNKLNNKLNDTYQTITVINGTNKYVNFSIIKDTTSATSAKDFYSYSHNYLNDFIGNPIKKQLLSPAGNTSSNGKLKLDRVDLKINSGSNNITIFVCEDNTYSNKDDKYINKAYLYLTGDRTITISASGAIY